MLYTSASSKSSRKSSLFRRFLRSGFVRILSYRFAVTVSHLNNDEGKPFRFFFSKFVEDRNPGGEIKIRGISFRIVWHGIFGTAYSTVIIPTVPYLPSSKRWWGWILAPLQPLHFFDTYKVQSNMPLPSIQDPAPNFTAGALLPNKELGEISLSDYRGRWVVFFWYPLDFT